MYACVHLCTMCVCDVCMHVCVHIGTSACGVCVWCVVHGLPTLSLRSAAYHRPSAAE